MTLLKLNRFQPSNARCTVWMLMCLGIGTLLSAANAQNATGTTSKNKSSKHPAPIKITTEVECSGGCMRKTEPVYPLIAKAAKVSGTVVLEATISKKGSIEDLRVVSGPPLLQQESLTAVRTWRYKPYLLNGVPMEYKTTVRVLFTLAEDGTAIAKATDGDPKIVEIAPRAAENKRPESK